MPRNIFSDAKDGGQARFYNTMKYLTNEEQKRSKKVEHYTVSFEPEEGRINRNFQVESFFRDQCGDSRHIC
jgi:hypothetical protein